MPPRLSDSEASDSSSPLQRFDIIEDDYRPLPVRKRRRIRLPGSDEEDDWDLMTLESQSDDAKDTVQCTEALEPAEAEDDDVDGFSDNISEQTVDFGLEDGQAGNTSFDASVSLNRGAVSEAQSPLATSSPEPVLQLPTSTLISPRSVALNYVPPLPVTEEYIAVEALLPLATRYHLHTGDDGNDDQRPCEEPEYVYLELDDFEIYGDGLGTKSRLRSLHQLGAGRNYMNSMYLDGILSVGGNSGDGSTTSSPRYYVQHVRFEKAPVDRYGTEFDTVRGHISIRSVMNVLNGLPVYYRLRKPSPVYARYYNPYVWVADLGKHFVDYLVDVAVEEGAVSKPRDVRIGNFRSDFSKWLRRIHPTSDAVKAWRVKYSRRHRSSSANDGNNDNDDFRQAVVAYGDYLWKEAESVLGLRTAYKFGFFRELSFTYYPTHPPTIPEGHPVTVATDRNGNDVERPLVPLPTVVTPYMFNMFKGLAIGSYLQSMPASETLSGANRSLDTVTILPQRQTPFTTRQSAARQSAAGQPLTREEQIQQIQPGDVISTLPDDMVDDDGQLDLDEVFRTGKCWYALVHRVRDRPARRGGRSFDVLWLYRPEDTPCGCMTYPWPKELFLSDNCTCGDEERWDRRGNAILPIHESEVARVHSVEWFGGPNTTADFFVRQTYRPGEHCWAQLRLSDLYCRVSEGTILQASAFSARYAGEQGQQSGDDGTTLAESAGQPADQPTYVVGDTVLVVLSPALSSLPQGQCVRSEPCEILAITHNSDKNDRTTTTAYSLRRLLRRSEVDPSAREAPPNELLYPLGSDKATTVDESLIVGPCLVRAFPPGAAIPTPYDRRGTGNVFFITHCWVELPDDPEDPYDVEDLARSVALPMKVAVDAPALRQGFDPTVPVPKLRALDLFCGFGNLGRGLGDAGIVKTRCANDYWPAAIHAFMANLDDPPHASRSRSPADAAVPFIGSADTLLELAIQGQANKRGHDQRKKLGIPAPGEIDLICAGSPCQGFSMLTQDKKDPQQFKNRSMVVSFASFVDLYRPKFVVFENVPSIIKGRKAKKIVKGGTGAVDEDIFGQLLCAIAGLGYQMRIVMGNAWSYGAPQMRQRVFLLMAAPGFALPGAPMPSHGWLSAADKDGGGGSSSSSSGINIGSGRRGMGRLVTGRGLFGSQDDAVDPSAVAFPCVTAGEATADLDQEDNNNHDEDDNPGNDDGMIDICVRYPDHRIVIGVTDRLRQQMAAIPTQPYGMGLAEVVHSGGHRSRALFSPAVQELFTKALRRKQVGSRAFRRAHPGRLFATVRTQCSIADGRSPGDLHWRAQRPLSVLEMRRAQGVPDEEVLLFAKPSDQWKMVGNAVSRQMALALGLSLRAAWLGGLGEGGEMSAETAATTALQNGSPTADTESTVTTPAATTPATTTPTAPTMMAASTATTTTPTAPTTESSPHGSSTPSADMEDGLRRSESGSGLADTFQLDLDRDGFVILDL